MSLFLIVGTMVRNRTGVLKSCSRRQNVCLGNWGPSVGHGTIIRVRLLDPRIDVRTMFEQPRVDSESGGTHHADEVQTSETDTHRIRTFGRLRVQGRAGRTGGVGRSTENHSVCGRRGQTYLGADPG